MTIKNNEFNRGLDKEALPAFKKYIGGQKWLQSLLRNKKTFFAIRKNYINIYGYGGSLVKLTHNPKTGDILGETHFKYLLRKKMKNGRSYVPIVGGKPQFEQCSVDLFADSLEDISSLLTQARLYAGEEKIGVHDLILATPNVLDTEIVFGKDTGEDADVIGVDMGTKNGNKNDRVDFCALHEASGGELKIVFYEAKTILNKELSGEVLEQLERYSKQLKERKEEIIKSYLLVCKNIVELFDGTDIGIPFFEFAKKVVDKSQKLNIDLNPRLVIFGFDQFQKDKILPALMKNLLDQDKKRLLRKDNRPDGNILSRGVPSGKWKELIFKL